MFADSTSDHSKAPRGLGCNSGSFNQHYSQNLYTRPSTAVQSPTISNSERVDNFTRTGNRRMEKGERERKRVADIRKNVETLRKRIDPDFLKGSSAKKPTRLQTLKDAICYICSLSEAVHGRQWKCRCVHVTGMAHRDIKSTLSTSPASSIDPSRSLRPYDPKNLHPHHHSVASSSPTILNPRQMSNRSNEKQSQLFNHQPTLRHHHIPNYC